MEILQAQIPATVSVAELSGLLAGPEFMGLWEQDEFMTVYWQGTREALIQELDRFFTRFNVPTPQRSIQIQVVKQQDWNTQWAASVKPIRIGHRIGIRPSWATMEMPDDGVELIIDPKQAFGTGHHATTQLLIEWLEDYKWGSKNRMLDVGTGSGILSMVALRLGATFAMGIDSDALAIECARDYAVSNGFTSELELRCGQIEEISTQPFHLIVANIDQKTLLALAPEFSKFRSSATQLFLSGLLEEDETDVVAQFTDLKWTLLDTRQREGWIALQFTSSM